MAKECDIVIGPETGVLSAVAMEPMKKIVFLSHSSVENLTRDWVNTVSLYSKNTPCYPCHKLIIAGTSACRKARPASRSARPTFPVRSVGCDPRDVL
jgi:hypothetical protein